MSEQNDNEPQEKKSDSSDRTSGESRFGFMVTGLLVIIMVALSALWLRERSRRVKFQQQCTQLQKSLQEARTRAMFAGLTGGTPVNAALVSKLQIMAANDQKPQFKIVREELATVPMTVNGKAVQVLQLSGTLGRRAGFLPGDMIHVTKPPRGGMQKTSRDGR